MVGLSILALLGLASVFMLFDGDGGNVDALPEDPEDQEDNLSQEMQDTGASVTETEGGVYVELGEDETGSLIAIKNVNQYETGEFIGGHEVIQSDYQLQLYLLPAGVDFPVDPAGTTFEDEDADELAELVDMLGLQELAQFDLGSLRDENGTNIDNRVEPPEITSNVDFDIIRINSLYDLIHNTETDESLSPFEMQSPFYLGASPVEVTGSAAGTDETDWLIAAGPEADGATLEGKGGDDLLDAEGADNVLLDGGSGNDLLYAGGNSTLEGGEGDDTIRGTAPGVLALGGAGSDQLTLTADGSTAYGGTGNDRISVYGSSGAAEVWGEDGDDFISVDGAQTTAHGGNGDDFLGLGNNATGYGDAGNDHLQLEEGSTGHGGAGDDLFTVWNFFNHPDGGAVATGGDGKDTYDVRVRNPGAGDTNPAFLQITDFDPDEDILMVGVFQTTWAQVGNVTIKEAADGSHTDVEVQYVDNGSAGPLAGNPAIAVIRLDGVTGFSSDQVIVSV